MTIDWEMVDRMSAAEKRMSGYVMSPLLAMLASVVWIAAFSAVAAYFGWLEVWAMGDFDRYAGRMLMFAYLFFRLRLALVRHGASNGLGLLGSALGPLALNIALSIGFELMAARFAWWPQSGLAYLLPSAIVGAIDFIVLSVWAVTVVASFASSRLLERRELRESVARAMENAETWTVR